jgi:hypothetical protein
MRAARKTLGANIISYYKKQIIPIDQNFLQDEKWSELCQSCNLNGPGKESLALMKPLLFLIYFKIKLHLQRKDLSDLSKSARKELYSQILTAVVTKGKYLVGSLANLLVDPNLGRVLDNIL